MKSVSQAGKPLHGEGDAPMLILKLIAGLIFNVASFCLLLFLPAGTWHWWRAWVVIGAVFVGTVGSVVGLAGGHAGLLEERLKPPVQKGQPLADKVILVLFITTFYGIVAFAPLDVFRFHLLAKPGPLVSSLGLAFLAVGWWIVYLGTRENAFAAPVVRYQEERHQTVIETGVYAVVRHPMYAGGVLFVLGIPLWLESYAGALLAIVPLAMLPLRILFEERFLRQELRGYNAYTERVRYRLIPFVW
jgi:protein-S-isoprenylcysteine O-methyltransferase Ste14